MQLLKELPKEQGFFNRYATLIPVLHKLSYLTQVISSLTEYGVFFALLLPKVREISPEYQFVIAGIGAAILVAVVEIGMRVCAPYSVRTILYKRWNGLDLPMSIFIWMFTIGLFGVSLFTSFQGSHDAIHEAYTTGASRDKIDQNLTSDNQAISSRYTKDSLQTAQSYDGQINAAQQAATATVSVKKEKLNTIERREASTGNSYLSQKSKLREEMAVIEATAATKVADLQAKKADALTSLLTRRETSTSEAKTTATTGVAKLEDKGNQYGGYLGWFTIICHVFFAIAVTMYEIVKKGSDIQERAIIGKYQFDQSILSEWWNVFSDKFQTHLRTRIRAWAAKTPEQPAPIELPTLHEYDREQKRLKVGAKQGINKELEIEETAEKHAANGYDAMFKEGVDLDDLFEQNGHSHNGNGYSLNNQFATHTLNASPPKRVVIQGFQPTGQSTSNENRLNENRIDENRLNDTQKLREGTRICEHCQTVYHHRHHKQKYCSNDCRIAAWEGRTGKTFNATKLHNTKRQSKGKKKGK